MKRCPAERERVRQPVAAMLSGCVSEGETAVELRGGRLFVTWDRTKNKVLLTGPAETVFEGTLAERI